MGDGFARGVTFGAGLRIWKRAEVVWPAVGPPFGCWILRVGGGWHHGQQPLIGHPPGNPIEQPLMTKNFDRSRSTDV